MRSAGASKSRSNSISEVARARPGSRNGSVIVNSAGDASATLSPDRLDRVISQTSPIVMNHSTLSPERSAVTPSRLAQRLPMRLVISTGASATAAAAGGAQRSIGDQDTSQPNSPVLTPSNAQQGVSANANSSAARSAAASRTASKLLAMTALIKSAHSSAAGMWLAIQAVNLLLLGANPG